MTISVTEALTRLVEHREIFHDEMLSLFRRLMSGELSQVQVAALISALRVKKETIGEITAAAQVMRELATPVQVSDTSRLVDLCGTGGDGAHSFNISTASMFVVAAAGGRVAKHGGRGVSSASGSADVLEALGGAINLTPDQVARSLDKTGIGFMFAPNHHSAMKHAAPVRKELGIRTIFNILGPLTNPAGSKRQLMGVFHKDLVGIQVRVLQRLGSEHVMIVHSHKGMDEIALDSPTYIGELVGGQVREYEFKPESVGIETQSHEALEARSPEASREKVLTALRGEGGAVFDIVRLNAGAALYVSDTVPSLQAGVESATQTIRSGAAIEKLNQWVQVTRALAGIQA